MWAVLVACSVLVTRMFSFRTPQCFLLAKSKLSSEHERALKQDPGTRIPDPKHDFSRRRDHLRVGTLRYAAGAEMSVIEDR